MDRIVEYNGYFGIKYKYIRESYTQEVTVVGRKKEYKGFTYMLIIGTNGNAYFEAYKYLNDELSDESYSTREQALRALKFLYSYIELFNTDIKYLDAADINKIRVFLKGGTGTGQYITYDFKTVRANSTVNSYFGVYRSFLRYLGIKNNIFEQTDGTKIITDVGSAFNSKTTSMEVQSYSVNLKRVESNVVPKYIRYSEYLKIIKLIEEKYTLREMIIVKLMYEYGLRIGEVLGLTLEDIHGEDITKAKGKYRLILRNRFTDEPWQNAKGLKVTSRNQSNNEEYYEKGDGIRIIRIKSDMYDLIQEYIDEVTSPFSMSEKTYENYSVRNLADKVSHVEIEKNAYVFISKNYTPITGGAWNSIMKSIFKEVGLEVDKGKRRDNLNHRFRHGFAMFKVLHEGYDELRLADALRHSNTNSVKKYFNPTEDDLNDFAIRQDALTKRGLNL
ncbi:tyrosine-type recombinase/integrase [Solibacillus isronensis]|uniref:tyrosine-type recombinase/integrase n=1 Tax=Solibacillus isronensis TaxID=412383 RepID=UPI0009A5EACE|nr:site-specific integrase [Solibacillus isronensis]